MRLYPDLPRQQTSLFARDALVVLALLLFALIGVTVHDAVDRLAVLGTGVREAGTSVQHGFDAAGDAIDGTPLVGGTLGDAFRGVGEGTGGNVADLGRSGENAVHRLANILGLLVFGLPTVVLLGFYLPGRVRTIRRLTAADRVLRAGVSPERTRLLAMRAVFSLPYAQLLEYSPDPFGDLEAGRYDALAAAVADDAGLQLPRAKPS